MRDALGRVETSDLDDVGAGGPSQLGHFVLRAQLTEYTHVILQNAVSR